MMNQLKKDRRLFFRIIGYIIFSLLGGGFLYSFHYFLLLCYFDGLSEFLTKNPIFKSTLSILILTSPLVTYNWYLKNKDTLKQFEIANRQQAETLFSNAVQQLLEGSSPIVKSVGLKELIRLKHNKSIESDRISLIASSGIDLQKAKLWGVNLQGENLQSADLRDANIQEANLQGINLQNADLLGANLKGANLQGADLQGAHLQSAGLRRANLKGANLQGAILQRAKLQEANLQSANLQEANLQSANLQEANLQGAILQRAKLQEANLQSANLQEANLQWANLQEVNLQNANIYCAQIKGAIYNTVAIAGRIFYDGKVSYTKFPEGFDPIAAGMILKNDQID